MSIADSIAQVLDQEAATTKRVLERIPNDTLDYRAHPKSMTLGQLAHHVATTPGGVAQMLIPDTVDFPDFPNIITSAATLAETFENACEELDAHLESMEKLKIKIPKPRHRLILKTA